MAENLRHNLQKAELLPPEGSWDTIQRRLKAEFDAGEYRLRERIYQAEFTPPEGSFEAITKTLQPRAAVKRINAPYLKVAVAAAILCIVSAAAFYIFNLNLPTSVKDSAVNMPVFDHRDRLGNASATEQVSETEQSIASKSPTYSLRPLHDSGIQLREINLPSYQAVQPESYPPGYVAVHADKLVIRPYTDIQVEAPPITDENGSVIMDMELVMDDSGQFLIVTGPNGQQVRLSEKFADKLAYLNKHFLPAYFDFESYKWIYTFDKWRETLLSHSDFIPTAGNYFDILELKELIQKVD